MIISAHVGAGALVGLVAGRPLPAIAAGFASHLVMDVVPHWGAAPGEDWIPVAKKDGIAGLAAMGLLTAVAGPERALAVGAGMVGACLPDTDKLGVYFVGRSPWPAAFDRFHGWIQTESPHLLPRDVAIAAGLIGAGAAVLHLFARSR
jgi:hypothetical protein